MASIRTNVSGNPEWQQLVTQLNRPQMAAERPIALKRLLELMHDEAESFGVQNASDVISFNTLLENFQIELESATAKEAIKPRYSYKGVTSLSANTPLPYFAWLDTHVLYAMVLAVCHQELRHHAKWLNRESVSYTHLTLPTIGSV